MNKKSSFLWDFERELVNIKKHGVDFKVASKVLKTLKGKFTSTPSTARKKKGFSVSEKYKIRF